MVNQLLEELFETVHYDDEGNWREEPLTEEDPDEITPEESSEELLNFLLSKALGDDIKLSVKAIICDADGKFLILRDSTPGSKFWDLPGGHVADGETLLDGLRRELKQEAGIDLVSEPEELFIREMTLGKETKPVVFYYLEMDSSAPDVKLSNEHTDFKWVNDFERKSYNLGVFHDILDRVFQEQIQKARPGLIPKKVKVEREGKQFQAIRWVRPEEKRISETKSETDEVKNHLESVLEIKSPKLGEKAKEAIAKVSDYLPYEHVNLVKKLEVISNTGVGGATFIGRLRLVLTTADEHTLSHEVGHFVWFMKLKDKDRNFFKNHFVRIKNGNAGFPTKYSKESEGEFFAECYRFFWRQPEKFQKRNSVVFAKMEEMFKR